MNKEAKGVFVADLAEKVRRAKGIFLAEYRGLKVKELSEVRREVKKNAGDFRVVKNRLSRRSVAGTAMSLLEGSFKGPIAIAFADQDPVIISKILARHAENFAALKLKAAVLDGRLLDEKGIQALAKLPSKEELYAKLLGTLVAPAQGLVRVLSGVPQKLAIALKAISEKRQ